MARISTDDHNPSTTTTTTHVAEHGGDTPTDMTRQEKIVIWTILVSAFVVILNETIIGVALPRIMADLAIDAATGQWLSTAFMLTLAIVIPTSGWLLQRFPTRAVFLGAITMFSIGTLLAALAPGFGVLLLARVVQATGTGVMMPLLMTTVMMLVPAHQRGRMMGNISIVMSMAPALGPVVAGLILTVLPWRWLFWLVLPIGIISLLLGAALIRNVGETTRAPLDVLSVVLSGLAFGGLVYGLSSLGEAAQGAAFIAPWIPLVVGVAALVLFGWRQRALEKHERALMDLRTFQSRGFTIGVSVMAAMMATLFGVIILLPIYAQDALHLSPLSTGVIVLPGGLLMGLAGPIVGRLYDKWGPRPLVIPGVVLVFAASAGMAALLGADSPWWLLMCGHLVLSAGLALTFTPLFSASLGSVEPRFYSHGSAIVGTVQQLAGAFGTALAIVMYTVVGNSVTSGGGSIESALASGARAAFAVSAVLAVVSFVLAFWLQRPAEEAEDAHHYPDGAST